MLLTKNLRCPIVVVSALITLPLTKIEAEDLTVMGGPSTAISTCQDRIDVINIVRVSLPDSFQGLFGKNNIGTASDDDDTVATPINSSIPKVKVNPFHIDLTALSDPKTPPKNPYTKVRVVLTGANDVVNTGRPSPSVFKFGTIQSVGIVAVGDPRPVASAVSAVAYGGTEPGDPTMLCAGEFHNAGDPINATQPNGPTYQRSVATFFIRYNPHHAGKQPVEIPYNIIITPTNSPDTPIVIDPKIENNG